LWTISDDLPELDAETINDLIGSFVQDTADRLERLESAANANELGGVRREAHSVKGSSRQMGAQHVADLCLQFEQNCQRYSSLELHALQDPATAFQSTTKAMLPSTNRVGPDSRNPQ
jgi:HPt (histidine-containing phosphotransfer) domain-containing protein